MKSNTGFNEERRSAGHYKTSKVSTSQVCDRTWRKAQVPIISFSATSPSLSPSQNKFFIRIAQDDSAQVKAIADIVKAFGWPEIVLIYEDTEYGNSLIPHLMEALLVIDTRVLYRCVIPRSSNSTEIIKELNKLKAKHIRIFLVHEG